MSVRVANVCPRCFGNESLAARVRQLQADRDDSACDFHEGERGVPLEEVAKIIDEVFRQRYGLAPDDYGESEGDDLESCVSELTECDEEDVGAALAAGLIDLDPYWPPDGGEPFYSDIDYYRRGDHVEQEHSSRWEEFRESIVHGQRFFNSHALHLLTYIFDGIHRHQNDQGVRPVRVIEPGREGCSFMRGRIANDPTAQERIAQDMASSLGPPPERLRKAGRMNSAGIQVFYGAYELETCLSELRPNVGDVVFAAKFELTRSLCVLDLSGFQKPLRRLDLFAKDQVQLTAQWQFMVQFEREITQPISPNDEYLNYIPTQAVAEYLVNNHAVEVDGEETRIEAIIYRSAQNPRGKNIALFGDGASVGLLDADRLVGNEGEQPEPAFPDLHRLRRGFTLAAKPDSLTSRIIVSASFDHEGYAGASPGHAAAGHDPWF